jgi:phage shock protein PspC (stress-responsive transcriptional regulator)
MTAHDEQGFARTPRGEGGWAAGVCAGLAERWQLPVAALRGAFVVTTFAFGAGLLLYAALGLTMPARGATTARAQRATEAGRTILLAGRVTGSVLALLGLAAVASGLALFGLGSVALLLASACVLMLLLRPALRPGPLAVAAVALTLPAAAVGLGDVQVARQVGTKTVVLRTPGEVAPEGYRAGAGSLLVDLRRFEAAPGSTTTIRARADLRSLVVALPRGRCFSLVVDQTLDRRWPARVLDQRNPAVLHAGAPARMPTDREVQLADAGEPPSLVAFGRPVFGSAVRFTRDAIQRQAPVLHLILTTGRSQAVVRDYPQTASPLADPWWPAVRIGAGARFGIPRGQLAAHSVPNDPLIPLYLHMLADHEQFFLLQRFSVSVMQENIIGRRLPVGVSPERFERLRRFIRQELLLREAAREADAYAVRFAGPCAPMRERFAAREAVPMIGSAHALSRLAARWNVITRRWPQTRRWLKLPSALMVQAEADAAKARSSATDPSGAPSSGTAAP